MTAADASASNAAATAILAFDTATPGTAVAIVDLAAPDAPVVLAERWEGPDDGGRPRHTPRLLPLVAELVAQAGGFQRIGRIAVGTGPGTFTGLRVGIATARALASARGLSLTGVSTLVALGAGARIVAAEAGAAAPVVAVIDARRGEVFAAAWTASGEELLAPAALAPEALAAELARISAECGAIPLAAGDGAVRFRDRLAPAGTVIPPDDSPSHRVSAAWLARLAGPAPGRAPQDVGPEYLRAPDARPTAQR